MWCNVQIVYISCKQLYFTWINNTVLTPEKQSVNHFNGKNQSALVVYLANLL